MSTMSGAGWTPTRALARYGRFTTYRPPPTSRWIRGHPLAACVGSRMPWLQAMGSVPVWLRTAPEFLAGVTALARIIWASEIKAIHRRIL